MVAIWVLYGNGNRGIALYAYLNLTRGHKMKAIVNEIQVCGGRIFSNLEQACEDYLQCLREGIDREKFNFGITLPNGQIKSITIRQGDEKVIAYGDFDELPSFLDYAEEVLNESK